MKMSLLVTVTALSLVSPFSQAETGYAGSHIASTQVSCVDGTVQKNKNNWITTCTLDRDQTFTRKTSAGAETQVRCQANRPAAWDKHGWLTRCTQLRPGVNSHTGKKGNTAVKLDQELPE